MSFLAKLKSIKHRIDGWGPEPLIIDGYRQAGMSAHLVLAIVLLVLCIVTYFYLGG
jgi:hypothetical protein